MSRVFINEKVLRWAVDRVGVTPNALQGKFPKIIQWLDGKRQPTLRQLESLARLTLTPLGFFFLANPPEERLPIPHFRTLGSETSSRPSPNLIETVQVMQRRQVWMREFLIGQGEKPLSFVRSAKQDNTSESVAGHIRQALDFDEEWASQESTWTDALRVLRNTIEKVGILVVVNGIVGNNTHRKLNVNEFRGFVLVDEYAPLVFVNGTDGKAAQMFTIAHELAHVFLGSSAAFDLREMQPADDPTERACNRIAAEFLVPERKLRRTWPSVKENPEPFQTIARQFKVSRLVAARRALDLGLIQRADFSEFYERYQNDEQRTAERRPEGGDFYINQDLRVGRGFASTIVRATKEGHLLYSEAYRLTGLHGRTFERYAKSFNIGGK